MTWGVVGANQLGGWNAAVPVGTGGFDVYSDGIGEWGTYDETTFVYEKVTGDFDKKLRVEYQDGSSEWARAGIIVRDAPTCWLNTRGARRQQPQPRAHGGRPAGTRSAMSILWAQHSPGLARLATGAGKATGVWTRRGLPRPL